MPPSKTSRMTANPVKPSRYRPGKPIAAEQHSSSEEDEEEDQGNASDNDTKQSPTQPRRGPPPKATSFPSDAAKKVTSNLKNVDLGERRRQAEAEEKAKQQREWKERQRQEREAGFVTESEDDEESGDEEASSSDPDRRKPSSAHHPAQPKPARPAPGQDESSSSSEEESDSDSDSNSSDSSAAAPRKHLRPVFIPKNQRNKTTITTETAEATAAAKAEADAARRAAETDAMVQERLERDAQARAAGKKSWDDDDPDEEELVDDTDGVDAELEHAQWVARELGRLKRARAALEAREAELAEVQRRKLLSTPEREAEDRAFIDAQNDDRKDRARANFMQRYHHKGAFYHDEDDEDKGLLRRDLMGARYESGHAMKEALPQFLQVRDEAMIGRKGRTKYRDLKSEDTGRWGAYHRDQGRGKGGGAGGGSFVDDERYKPDYDREGPSGANASAMGDRKRTHGDGDGGRSEDAKRPRREEPLS